VGAVRIQPVAHSHGNVEAYGLVLDTSEGRVGFVTDARFSPDLAVHYAGCHLLVLNVVLKDWKPGVDHLSLPEAGEIISAVKPRLAVLTHFGMTMLRANPRTLAAALTEQIGIPVVAAGDGLTLDAAAWSAPPPGLPGPGGRGDNASGGGR